MTGHMATGRGADFEIGISFPKALLVFVSTEVKPRGNGSGQVLWSTLEGPGARSQDTLMTKGHTSV
jgi:hypothetical protein